MQRHSLALIAASAALATGGCAPAMRLEPAPVLLSDEWSGGGSAPAASEAQPLAVLLGSPELALLTERALARNAQLAIASARVDQAQALLRSARQAGLPGLSGAAGLTRDRGSRAALPDFSDAFAQLDFEFTPDLFGRLGAERGAAFARTRAAELERKALSLTIESELASAFVQRAALAARLEILDASIARAAELERVIRIRAEEGVATRVDLGLQAVQLLNLRERHSRLEEALGQTSTALALLAGEEAPLFAARTDPLGQFALPALVPPPPADLLAARPDLQAAEALIAAAEGDVRAARAGFFPQVGVSLSGLLDNLISAPLGQSVNLGSSLLAPIFSRGRLQSQFAFASAAQVESVERYRLAILSALGQVEDARSAIVRSAERARLVEDIVGEAGTTARLANLRYIEGEEDLLSLLDAQQLLNQAEEARVLATQEQLFARIALYRAAGGQPRAVPTQAVAYQANFIASQP